MQRPLIDHRLFAAGRLTVMLSVAALPVAAGAPFSLDAEPVLEAARQAFPKEPIRLEGDLAVKSGKGERRASYETTILFDWRSEKPGARITLSDAFGEPLTEVIVSYASGNDRPPELEREGAPLPDLLDMDERDLALTFLWWPDGRVVGEDRKKGRPCHVLDMPAPVHADLPYRRVRLWVDREVAALLQADYYGEDDRLLKRMEVKSFKKQDDRWMLQKLEVVSYPSMRKTLLYIRSMDVQNSGKNSFSRGPEGSTTDRKNNER